jgi:hypothetical protein
VGACKVAGDGSATDPEHASRRVLVLVVPVREHEHGALSNDNESGIMSASISLETSTPLSARGFAFSCHPPGRRAPMHPRLVHHGAEQLRPGIPSATPCSR